MEIVIGVCTTVISGLIIYAVNQHNQLRKELAVVKEEVLKTLTKIAEQNAIFHEKFINEATFKERVSVIVRETLEGESFKGLVIKTINEQVKK